MALEFISSEGIFNGKRISIPEGANCYRIKSEKIKFFRKDLEGIERVKFIPKNPKPRKMSFEGVEKNAHNIEYGEPVFYE